MTQHASGAGRATRVVGTTLRARRRVPLAAAAAVVSLTVGPVATAAAAPPSDAPVVVRSAGADAVDGSYIVTLEAGTDAEDVAADLGVVPDEVYDVAVDGFAADLDADELAELVRDPDVVAVEEDAVVTLDATQRVAVGGGLYGLDRIDQRSRPLSGSYTYATTASGVTAYVIDTGIATSHRDFGGRARNVYDALGGNGQDCNGHGTHVAGTIGSATYGVAKGVALRGVRVLGCDGSGSTSGIIAAIDWVRGNAVKPAVANMSLGGGYSAALNRAVDSLAASGVSIAVAAGNESQDACSTSPASASGALAVAASDKNDARASFSNYGSCAQIYAPGVDVTSTWLDGGTTTISGTSMASPHVAGAMALVKARYGDLPSSEVNATLVQNATTGVISRNVGSTPNRLLYKGGL